MHPITALKYMQQKQFKGRRNKFSRYRWRFQYSNTLIKKLDRKSVRIWKTWVISQLCLTEKYRTLHPATAEYTCFESTYRALSTSLKAWDYLNPILGARELNQKTKSYILQSHVEINNRNLGNPWTLGWFFF